MTPSDFTTTPAEAAIRYAAWGWPVLPIHTPTSTGCSCRHPDCTNEGKHPRIRRGVHQATTNRATIESWWQRWPDANVAIATGVQVIIDIDGDTGARSLEALQRRHGPLPSTAWVSTSRGRHLYFSAAGLAVRNSAGRLGAGLDVRGKGGYAIAPPSLHHTGHRYTWHDLERGIPSLPSWLATLLKPARPATDSAPVSCEHVDAYVRSALEGELRRIATAAPHTRNNTLNRAAFRLGQLAGVGFTSPDVLAVPLLEAARAVGQGEREARATIASGLAAGFSHPRPTRRGLRQPLALTRR